MFQNQKFLNISTFILLVLSLVWLKEINFLFYNSAKSPDYPEYIIYFEHFANSNLTTGREHGLMYYYLHYLNSLSLSFINRKYLVVLSTGKNLILIIIIAK